MLVLCTAQKTSTGRFTFLDQKTVGFFCRAIHACGGVPVFVEIGPDWLTDLDDLRAKAAESGARFFMLSHMRGHIADMEAITAICTEFGITLIEDCAHTMGASWQGTRSGNFGSVACFSTQTYKHMNSGEGGFLTTDNPEIAARAIILSGSYMLSVLENLQSMTPKHARGIEAWFRLVRDFKGPPGPECST